MRTPVAAVLLIVSLNSSVRSAEAEDPFEPVLVTLRTVTREENYSMSPPLVGIQPSNQPEGTVVFDVHPNSPAGKAGIRIGDRLASVNGVTVNSAEHFRTLVLGPAGTTFDIELLDHDGGSRTVTVVKAPISGGAAAQFALMGRSPKLPQLTVSEADDRLRLVESGEGTVRGTISDGQTPLPGIEIALRIGANDKRSGYAVTDEKGVYEISVPTGPAVIYGFNVRPGPGLGGKVIANQTARWRGLKLQVSPGRSAELPRIVISKPVILVAPRKFAVLGLDDVRFDWSAYPGASAYRLQVMPYPLPGEDLADLIEERTVTNSDHCCYARPDGLDPRRDRFVWRVFALDRKGEPVAKSSPLQGEFFMRRD